MTHLSTDLTQESAEDQDWSLACARVAIMAVWTRISDKFSPQAYEIDQLLATPDLYIAYAICTAIIQVHRTTFPPPLKESLIDAFYHHAALASLSETTQYLAYQRTNILKSTSLQYIASNMDGGTADRDLLTSLPNIASHYYLRLSHSPEFADSGLAEHLESTMLSSQDPKVQLALDERDRRLGRR